MDKLKKYRSIISTTLKEHIGLPSKSFPNLQDLFITDKEQQHFMILTVGWDRDRYQHGIIYHIELKSNGKVWIHEVASDVLIDKELIEAGIVADDIVAGMIEPYELNEKAEGECLLKCVCQK